MEEYFEQGDSAFIGRDLSGSDLSGVDVEGIDLTDANLSNAYLTSARLSNVNFTNANLSNANFTNADLSGANLTGANLSGAIFMKTNLDGTGFEHLRQEPPKKELKRDITHTAYLETARRSADGHGRHKVQSGGNGQFADIKIKFEPISSGDTAGATEVIDAAKTVVYVNKVGTSVINSSLMSGVPTGIKEAKGILIGAPLTNVRITALDGQKHDVDSSKEAFKTAILLALNDAMAKASMLILEPVYELSIETTEETLGDVMSALTHNLGSPQGMKSGEDGIQIVQATLPYRKFASFEEEVKNVTGEDARFSAQFDHYEEMPRRDMDALIAEHQK